jgi:hypothetical protein
MKSNPMVIAEWHVKRQLYYGAFALIPPPSKISPSLFEDKNLLTSQSRTQSMPVRRLGVMPTLN